MERSVKPPTGRVVRRAGFVVAVLVVALAAGGCFVFDKERRENFKGPSWDVPLTIPLANLTVDGTEIFEFEEGGFEYSRPIEGEEKELPMLPAGNVESIAEIDHSERLDELWDELSLAEGIHVELPQEDAVFIVFTLSGDERLTTNFDLTLTPRKAGLDSGELTKRISLRGGESQRVDISSIISGKPDELHVYADVGVKSEERLEDVTIKFDAELLVRLPSTVTVAVAENGFEAAKPEPVAIDADAKKSLEDIPLKNFSIVANVTDARDPDATDPAVPLQFAVEFYSAPPAMDAAPVRYVVSLAGGQPDADAWAKIRDKLSGPDPHVGMKVLAESADKKLVIDSDASYRVEAYMVIEMNVNKR